MSSGEITQITAINCEPDESIVQLLEELLNRAREGRIIAICGVARYVGEEFAEFYSHSATEQYTVPFLGYLRVMQMRLEREIPMDIECHFGGGDGDE